LVTSKPDIELVTSALDQEMIIYVICTSFYQLLEQVRGGCGPFILADEAISQKDLEQLLETLDKQPDLADLPGIIIWGIYSRWKALDFLITRRSIYLIQRPVKKSMFIQMVRAAMQVRCSQYRIRGLAIDLKQTNEKLNSRTVFLQQLALELTNSEERERRRIARILHDDLQQILVFAKIQLEMLTDSLKGEKAQTAHKLYATFSKAMDTIRSLSHELNPSFLHKHDLSGALKKIAVKMGENYGLHIETTIELESDQITEGIKIFVCRSVQELLFNCVKHAESEWVNLEITGHNNFLTVTVTDHGVGFDPKKLEIRGGREGGFGLLSIQERAEAIGGSFQVESSPNKGSRIYLKVPARTEVSEDRRTLEISDRPEKGGGCRDQKSAVEKKAALRVIIADDHAIMRQGLASLLQNQPDIIVAAEATNGEQAVELAVKLRPDVVLMDVSMPLLNGVEATRRIKTEAPEVAVIGLSMHSSEEVRRRMIDAGARDYLIKDRPAPELLSAIKKFAHSH
jgi:signal transduction histidine kinase/CheY-like chemotaxis protein